MMLVWNWSGEFVGLLPHLSEAQKSSPNFSFLISTELCLFCRPWAERLGFCGRVVAENIFFSEDDKVVLGKVFEFWFRGFKRKDLADKFTGRSLGNSRPYPFTPVSELNDAAWFNQYRPRVLQSFVKILLIEQDEERFVLTGPMQDTQKKGTATPALRDLDLHPLVTLLFTGKQIYFFRCTHRGPTRQSKFSGLHLAEQRVFPYPH